MKKLLLLLLSMTGVSSILAQSDLSVRVIGFKHISGNVELCLFDNEEGFMKQAVSCQFVKVEKEAVIYSFKGIANGTYAVVVFQDLNDNQDLDTNFMGMPKEPYGFSNNPSTTFGPPNFEGARFEVENDTEIVIKLK